MSDENFNELMNNTNSDEEIINPFANPFDNNEATNDIPNITDETSSSTIPPEEHPNTIEYRNILAQREEYMKSIRKHLEKLNFTEDEMKIIFDIIEYHYILMETAKIPLIQVTANDNLNEVEKSVKEGIKEISEHMLKVAREKVQEIMAGKK